MRRHSRGSTTPSRSREHLGCDPPLLHLAASSAGIREPEARFGLVRFGIAAYGISPFGDESGRELGLIPVMTIRGPVLDVHEGLATVGIGSGDGIQPAAIGVGGSARAR